MSRYAGPMRLQCGRAHRRWAGPLVVALALCSGALAGRSEVKAATYVVRQEQVIRVDGTDPGARDENPGSVEAPVRTIGRAIELADGYNAKSIPVRIVIGRGTYRESLVLFGNSATTSAPLTLEGHDVTISGSDLWTGWAGGDRGIYAHPWPYTWGLAELPDGWDGYAADYLARNPVIRRSEMMFLGGKALQQVTAMQEMEASENSFLVDEGSGQIFIHVAEGTDLGNTPVEVAIRPSLLQVGSRENVTISGLTFEHASSSIQGAAVSIASSSKVQLVGSRFIWNSWAGLNLYQDEEVEIKGVVASHNGVSGMTGSRIRGLLVEDSEASYNNWRGASGWNVDDHKLAIDANFIDFATGQKFFNLRDATFDNYRAIGNLTGGLWLDYDNADVTLRGITLRDNLTHGLMLEASQGPISITDSTICGNETGIISNNASAVRVESNLISGNLLGQVFLAGGDGERPVTEFDTGTQIGVASENWVFHRNRFGTGAGSLAFGTYLNEGWSAYVESMQSDHNEYTNPSSDEIFGVRGGQTVALAQWQAMTGQDTGSTFSLTQPECTASAPQGAGSPSSQGSSSPTGASAQATTSATSSLLAWLLAAGLIGGLVWMAVWVIRRNRRPG